MNAYIVFFSRKNEKWKMKISVSDFSRLLWEFNPFLLHRMLKLILLKILIIWSSEVQEYKRKKIEILIFMFFLAYIHIIGIFFQWFIENTLYTTIFNYYTYHDSKALATLRIMCRSKRTQYQLKSWYLDHNKGEYLEW